MTRQLLLGAVVFLAAGSGAFSDDKTPSLPRPNTNANFDKIKKMVGTWVAADKDGKPTDQVVSVIRLTAGGSAIHETIFPGQPMEMISVYTCDGPDLIMTHYCVLGNQPRMRADAKSPANQVIFKFDGGNNLDVKKDKHMHGATLTFIDDDHVELVGEGWDNGAPAKDMCCGMKIVRKK